MMSAPPPKQNARSTTKTNRCALQSVKRQSGVFDFGAGKGPGETRSDSEKWSCSPAARRNQSLCADKSEVKSKVKSPESKVILRKSSSLVGGCSDNQGGTPAILPRLKFNKLSS
eukprot:2847788-Rhodomonas_salina.4